MGIDEKAENTVDDAKGQAKESWGKTTDDEQLEAEGKADQAKSSVNKAGENVKDAWKDATK